MFRVLASNPQCRSELSTDSNTLYTQSAAASTKRESTSRPLSSTNTPHARLFSRCMRQPNVFTYLRSAWSYLRRRSWRHLFVLGLVVVVMAAAFVEWVLLIRGQMGVYYSVEDARAVREWNASQSILITHQDPLGSLHWLQRLLNSAGQGGRVSLRRTQLPSWTLHNVEAACTECLDSATHAAAVARHRGDADAPAEAAATVVATSAVYATPTAPLGLAGPMLLAMASVTDGVDAGAELSRWSWVRRSYALRWQFAGAAPAGLRGGTSPYLVVMGIPSTDQPVRSSLRDAQRATWLSYREVARSGNDFVGALLPLYIFAAAERDATGGVTDVSALLPTVAEHEAASAAQLRAGGADVRVPAYAERRVQLVAGFGGIGAGDARLADSPCARIVARTAGSGDTGAAAAGAAAGNGTWVSRLVSALSLPATPAAVASAEYICHASTALWQEALTHRNALWVDMMTDRKPTSDKQLGVGGNWGLAVEVGMSQKLMLWLSYAYHAFPDVPYIMKGDDDTYLKVPQFLRDIRHVRSGYKEKFPEVAPAVRDPPGVRQTEECIYWGSRFRNRHWNKLLYHEGSGYMMHRRIVQTLLEDTNKLNVYAMYVSVHPFDRQWKRAYENSLMIFEDAYLGRMIRDKRQRIREVCPFGYASYVEEPKLRHCDLYNEDRHNVTWVGLLLHHCSPTDEYALHYYFQHEHHVAAAAGRFDAAAEAAANASVKQWIVAHVPSTTYGFHRRPPLHWTHAAKRIESVTLPDDNVTVYGLAYKRFDLAGWDSAFVSIMPKDVKEAK